MTGSFVPFPYFIFHPNSSLHFFFFNSSCTFHLFLWCYSFLVLMGMLSNAALIFSVSSLLSSGSLASGDASIYIFEMFNVSVFCFFFCSFHLSSDDLCSYVHVQVWVLPKLGPLTPFSLLSYSTRLLYFIDFVFELHVGFKFFIRITALPKKHCLDFLQLKCFMPRRSSTFHWSDALR